MNPQQAQRLIQRAASPSVALFVARSELPSRAYPQFLQLAKAARNGGKQVIAGYLSLLSPRNWASLANSKIPPPIELERNLAWLEALLLPHATTIAKFTASAVEYEALLLDGNLDEARMCLVSIASEHGPSLWLLQARLHLEQVHGGLEAQKAFLQQLRPQLANIPAFLAHQYSHRLEPETSWNVFNETTNARLKHIPDSDFKRWITYWCVNRKPENTEELNEILNYNSILPILDQYLSLVGLLPYLAALAFDRAKLERVARTFERATNDTRLTRFLALLGEGTETAALRLDLTDGSPLDGALALGAWGTEMSAPSRTLYVNGRDLWEVLVGLFTHGAIPRVRSELEKIALSHSHLRVSAPLALILANELQPKPLHRSALAAAAFAADQGTGLIALPHLPDTIPGPREIEGPPQFAQLALTRMTGGHSTAKPDVPTAIAKAEFAAVNGQPDLALAALTDEQELSPRQWRLGERARCSALLVAADTFGALQVAVAAALRDVGILPMLPWADLANRIDARFRASHVTNIRLPLFYYFCSLVGVPLKDRELEYSYEDFLLGHGLKRPTDLKDHDHVAAEAELELYLRRICVLDTMRVSTAFKNSDELLEERASICAWLADLNPDLTKVYQEEISEITRKQAIRAAVRHVEQSKISFDEAALKRWCDENLAEPLSRYLAMQAAGLAPKQDLSRLLETTGPGGLGKEELPQIPQDEAGQLIVSIIKRFFREATSNPEIGLNCFLSMRVRHGALAGQLRSPVEQHNVISQRAREGGPYKPNEYWRERFSGIDLTDVNEVEKILRAFSERYDDLTEKLSSDYIQIHGDEHPEGLFRLLVSALDVQEIMHALRPESDTTDLFDALLSIYKESLAETLQHVRTYLDKHFRESVTQLFNSLQDDIATLKNGEALHELLDAIKHASTAAQYAISGLLEWFRPSERETSAVFSFEELIRVALQCIQRRHPAYQPDLNVESPEDIKTHSLVLFTDMLTIVLDNIRIHSGNAFNPHVEITISLESDHVGIDVKSRLYEGVDRAALQARVTQARELIASGDAERISREGRSGFVKLKRLVGKAGFLEFGLGEEEVFRVSLTIPSKTLRYETSDS